MAADSEGGGQRRALARRGSAPANGHAAEHVLDRLSGRDADRAASPADPADHACAQTTATTTTADTAPRPRDDKAAAALRRAGQRAERITAGLDDLELWLGDQIRTGLTTLKRAGYREIDEQARRLVDAQAPGVAGMVRDLAGVLAEEDWADRTLTEFALLHLLVRGWRHRDGLPAPLAATVRRRIGLSSTAADNARVGEHVADDWLVLGSRDSLLDKLVERRTWLQGRSGGRIAMLLSFAPPGQSPGPDLQVGGRFSLELVFVPEAAPLRAMPARPDAIPPQLPPDLAFPNQPAPAPWFHGPNSPGTTLDDLAERYAATLAADPWTTGVPGVVGRAELGFDPAQDAWWVLDQATSSMVALTVPGEKADRFRYQLLAACSGRPVALFGEYRPSGFTPITVFGDGRAVSV
ncbi:MAG TPA: hypothetical protein VGX23_03860 [Actinocrinis sp.]|nr:hypothetical protein [Actinocrinis sp.]